MALIIIFVIITSRRNLSIYLEKVPQSSISVDLPLKFALCVAIFFRAVCFKREKILRDPLYFLHFQNYTCISLPSYTNLLKFIPTLNFPTVESCRYTKVRKIHVCEIIIYNIYISLLQITVFFSPNLRRKRKTQKLSRCGCSTFFFFPFPKYSRFAAKRLLYHLWRRRRPNLWPIFLSISPGFASRASRQPRPRSSRFPPLPDTEVFALTSHSVVHLCALKDILHLKTEMKKKDTCG